MSMIEEAAQVYSKACRASGEDKEFTARVAKLVGRSSESYDDLRSIFRLEASIMNAAADECRDRHERRVNAGGGVITKQGGHCDKCSADGVAVGAIGMGLHACLACQIL